MTVCVFLGPTLALAEAEAILPAHYLPPARRGDIHRAVLEHDPQALAIVDGYFEQVPAVWHKELLWALDRGVALYGAASMGALRAAELAQFGMVGIGAVFEGYSTGRFAPFDDPFEDDDEVAVVHGPAEIGYASSDAMVDIRATLAAAHGAGILDAEQMGALAALGKAMFYKHRSWPALLRSGRQREIAPVETLDSLEGWLPAGRVPQKRMDAEMLLRHLANEPQVVPPPAFRFERTVLWEDYLQARRAR